MAFSFGFAARCKAWLCPAVTIDLKRPTRGCAARSDSFNDVNGGAEPRLTSGGKADAKLCREARNERRIKWNKKQ